MPSPPSPIGHISELDTFFVPQPDPAGDAGVIAQELIDLVPESWTSSDAKQAAGIFWALMTTLAQALQSVKAIIAESKLQLRVLTAEGRYLDLISQDFFGKDPNFRLPRAFNENDDTFRDRIEAELLRPHASPDAIIKAVESVTGAAPSFFEPFNVLGTGSWGGAWRTGGANFADNQIQKGIGGYGNGSMNKFQNVDGTAGGSNPQDGINALGDLGQGSAYTFFVTVTVNPKHASLDTIASVVSRVKPAGTVGYVTLGGITEVV